MKKIIFTIALFLVSSQIFAGEDITIKYLSLEEMRDITKGSDSAKDIQKNLRKVGLKIDSIDGVLGNQTKVAFDSIKARLLFMNLDTNDEYNDKNYRNKPAGITAVKNEKIKTKTKNIDIKTNKDTLLFIIIFLLVSNLIYLISKPKIDRIVKNLISKYIEDQANEDDSKIKNKEIIDNKNDMSLDSEKKYKDLENENISLKSKVKNLELKIQNLESEILRLKSITVNVKSDEKMTENEVENEVIAELIKENIIYASDLVDGFFTRVSNYKNTNSFYIIKHKENSDYGSFDIIDDSYVKNLAFTQVVQFIYPLFSTKNILGSFRNFKTTPGRAKLENGKWRIIEKGTVEFY